MELYDYIGPPELKTDGFQTARFRVQRGDDVREWARTQIQGGEELVATFVVDFTGTLWIADRRSEHIACARGGRVQTAGELTIEIGSENVMITGATNQSTGFCPRVESWAVLERALYKSGLAHPPFWTTAFEFRRCETCGALNLVKDEWFVCIECDADLPKEWNMDNAHPTHNLQG